MPEGILKEVSDLVSQAHTLIQARHKDLNPVVGVRQGMREMGIPADSITIDCLRSRKRILIVLHDEQPEVLLYQFASMDGEIEMNFTTIARAQVSKETFVVWMRDYFLN